MSLLAEFLSNYRVEPSPASCIQLIIIIKKVGKSITTTTTAATEARHIQKGKTKQVNKKAFKINAKFEDVGLTQDYKSTEINGH